MEVCRRSSWLLLLLGVSLLATTLQGVQGEAESEGPSESECRPYIEKALKELETGESGTIGTPETGDSKEDISTIEVTTDDSAHQEGEGDDDTHEEGTESIESVEADQNVPDEQKSEQEESQQESAEEIETEHDTEDTDTQEDTGASQEQKAGSSDEGEDQKTDEAGDDADTGEDTTEVEGEEQAEQETKSTEDGESLEDTTGDAEGEAQDTEEEGEDTQEEAETKEEETDTKEDTESVEAEAQIAEQEETGDDTQEETDETKEEDGDDTQEQADEPQEEEVSETKEEADETKEEQEDAAEAQEEEIQEGAEAETESVEGEIESTEEQQGEDVEAQESEQEETQEEVDTKEGQDETAEDQEDETGEDTKSEPTEDDKSEDAEVDKSEATEDDKSEATSDDKSEATGDDKSGSTEDETAEEQEGGSTETETTGDADEKSAEKDDSTPDDAQQQESEEDKTAEAPQSESAESTGEVEESVTADVVSAEGETQSVEGEEQSAEDEVQSAEGDGGSEGEKSDEEQESAPEEELSFDVEIPTDLRDRSHVEHLLKVDEEASETEKIINRVAEITLRELKKLYENAIKPLEVLYKYRDLSNRHFGDAEIFSKPLILFMGPWSGGKSSIINYLLDNEYNETSLRTGAEPSPAYFNILMHGEEPEIWDGTQLAADFTFSGLQKFGQGLEERLRGVRLPSNLLEKVNIVEIPGILEVRKQVSRVFPFNDACQWFIDRADIIFLVYDPSKLDVGPETEAILDQLKGREHQSRIILNKADQVKPEELMRVQGALIWNISPLMSSAQPPVMYTTSLWSRPYESWAPTRLLQAQERAFLRDLRSAVDKRIENKIASARRFAVRVRNHAKMVDCYLTTYYNHKSVFGNRKQVADEIIEHPQDYHIYEGLSTLTNISRYDLPDPDVYKDFFKLNPLYDFQQLSATCTYFRGCPINRLDVAIAYDLPELVGKHKRLVESALAEANQTPVPSS